MKRIGIYGLTGDPLHNQHLAGPEQARTQLGLDIVIYVTSGQPVDKPNASNKEMRHAIVEAGVADNPHFIASRVEIDRCGPSYMVDTLCAIRQEYGQEHEYFVIVGEDRAATITNWRDPERIAKIAQLVVIPRGSESLDRKAIESMLPDDSVIHLVEFNWSSTFLRKTIAAGKSVRYMVSPAVSDVIKQHELYAPIETVEMPAPPEIVVQSEMDDSELIRQAQQADEEAGRRIARVVIHIMFWALIATVSVTIGPISAACFVVPYVIWLRLLSTRIFLTSS